MKEYLMAKLSMIYSAILQPATKTVDDILMPVFDAMDQLQIAEDEADRKQDEVLEEIAKKSKEADALKKEADRAAEVRGSLYDMFGGRPARK